MIQAVRQYLSDFSAGVGSGWNQFWFTARSSWQLALLRQLVGGIAFVWLMSYSFQLTDLFGESGALSPEAVHRVVTGGNLDGRLPGFSHLFLVQSDGLLWATHGACLVVLLLVALGVYPGLTTPLGFIVVLSYIHRGSIITGLFEPVLSMLLLYLSMAPAVSVGSLIRSGVDTHTWRANVVTRLIQIHLCGFYLLMGLSQLGTPVWWTGEASWYLMNDAQHRLANLSLLTESNYVFNGITHAWVLFELLFPLLVWQRLARPLLIVVSMLVWLWTATVTGLVGFAVIMTVANLAFVSSETVSRWFGQNYSSTANSPTNG